MRGSLTVVMTFHWLLWQLHSFGLPVEEVVVKGTLGCHVKTWEDYCVT